jgi:rRNA maturation endonuclease Nob1
MTKTTEMEYEMNCPECKGVYTDDREWTHCPFCGVAVDVVAVRECDPAPFGEGRSPAAAKKEAKK